MNCTQLCRTRTISRFSNLRNKAIERLRGLYEATYSASYLMLLAVIFMAIQRERREVLKGRPILKRGLPFNFVPRLFVGRSVGHFRRLVIATTYRQLTPTAFTPMYVIPSKCLKLFRIASVKSIPYYPALKVLNHRLGQAEKQLITLMGNIPDKRSYYYMNGNIHG